MIVGLLVIRLSQLKLKLWLGVECSRCVRREAGHVMTDLDIMNSTELKRKQTISEVVAW